MILPLLVLLICCPSLAAEETLPAELGSRRAGIDWPDFLGPGRASKSPEQGIRTDWNENPPRIVWQLELGTSYGMPAISRGRLLHFDRHGDQARLTCRESETGRELWRYEHETAYSDMLGYNNGPRCSPVVDGNRVYTYSAEGQLHCVSLDEGKKIWSVDTFERFGVVQNFFGVGSTPIVADELLIVNVGGSPPGSPPDIYSAQGQVEGNGTGVVAFDKWTGEVAWQASDELASYASPVLATIEDRPWCFLFARGGLLGLDPRSGEVDFHFPWRAQMLESVNASCPVVIGKRVFISETYRVGSALLEVRPGGYDVVWQDEQRARDKSLELHWNTAVHHEGYLYGSSGRHRAPAELRCIELETGKVRWNEPGLGRSSLLQIDGHFICLSEDGTLRLLRVTPERYELLGELSLQDDDAQPLLKYPAWAAPIVSHGLLYVRGKDRLVCLELIAE
ncbi:MAG: PQQ-like beta-propeller repeat protein [Planctomycetales bacterium]|nr:PQQ-like beta-propeller repeat protein [Planctomycetales bacterium]